LISSASDVDVLFLGDSITEHWLGTTLGQADNRYVGIAEAYQQLFGTTGGKYSAIPLGLSGDRVSACEPKLLYSLVFTAWWLSHIFPLFTVQSITVSDPKR
jgi:hypothetical protein